MAQVALAVTRKLRSGRERGERDREQVVQRTAASAPVETRAAVDEALECGARAAPKGPSGERP